MTTPARRAARDQPLPEVEAFQLHSLEGLDLHQRCRDLYAAGWTLRAIGEAMSPPRSRSTIRFWVTQPEPFIPDPSRPPLPAPRTPENIQTPVLKTLPVYIPKRPTSPGVSPTDVHEIQIRSPRARKFRSGMSPRHPVAIANSELTDICDRLHASGVSVQELADIAGVTYRAMAKRLKKVK